LYINDLLAAVFGNAKLVLYADDTSITVTYPNHDDYVKNVDKSFFEVSPWFSKNLLSINHQKTSYLQFRTTNSLKLDLTL
jgi:hypothetical protein